MKYGCPLIAVKDIKVSQDFYEKVLRQEVFMDLGGNVSFGDDSLGFALQADWDGLVGVDGFMINYKSNDHELVFEEENFDDFEIHLKQFPEIIYLHKTKEYPWGQRVIRFYDPDFHIIEVGESMGSVFKKFYKQGMSIDEVAKRTSHPVDYVQAHLEHLTIEMDTTMIKEVLQRYFDALFKADAGELSALFHDTARIYSHDENGAAQEIDKESFMKIISEFGPNSENPKFTRSDEILAIDFISEDVAVARVKLRFGNSICTDIVNLMRINGTWCIMCVLDSRVNMNMNE